MSEATGRAEMERRLIQRSMEDESFRQRLLEDPKAVVEQELGARLPAEVRVRAVEETADTIYLVLPGASSADEAGELSERELESRGRRWLGLRRNRMVHRPRIVSTITGPVTDVSNDRGRDHERSNGRPRWDRAKADREKPTGRILPPEAAGGPQGDHGAGAGRTAARRGAGTGGGGDGRHHLPGASQRLACRRRWRGSRTRTSTRWPAAPPAPHRAETLAAPQHADIPPASMTRIAGSGLGTTRAPGHADSRYRLLTRRAVGASTVAEP